MAVSQSELRVLLTARDEASAALRAVSQSAIKAADDIGRLSTAATSQLGNATRSVNDFGSAVRQGIGIGAGFSVVTAAIGGVSAAMGAAKGSVIDFNSQMEQSQIAFTTMFDNARKASTGISDLATSGREAQNFLAQLQQFAQKTPFDLPSLVDGARRLQAMGFQANQTIPILTDLGNATAALGGNAAMLNRLILALGQMQAKGKVTAQDMRQLAEAGIPAWRILAEAMGKSQAEVMKLSENGEIAANVFINAFHQFAQANFGGMMEAQSHTFQGAVQNIHDSLDFLVGASFRPLFTVISQAADHLATFLQSDRVTQFGRDMQATVGEIVQSISPLGDAFNRAFAAFNTGGIQGALGSLMSDLQDFGRSLFGAGYDAVSEFANGFLQGAGDLIAQAAEAVATVIASFLIGQSPPPQGPLSQIDQGGEATAAAWVEGFGRGTAGLSTVVQGVADTLGNVTKELSLSQAAGNFEQATGNLRAMQAVGTDVAGVLRNLGGVLREAQSDQRDLANQARDIKDAYDTQIQPLERQIQSLKGVGSEEARNLDLAQRQADLKSRQADIEDKAALNALAQRRIAAEGDPRRRAELQAQLDASREAEKGLQLNQRAQDLARQINEQEQKRAEAKAKGKPFDDKEYATRIALLRNQQQQLGIEQQIAGVGDKRALAQIKVDEEAIRRAQDQRHLQEQTTQLANDRAKAEQDIARAQREQTIAGLEQQVRGLKQEREDALAPVLRQEESVRRTIQAVQEEQGEWRALASAISAAETAQRQREAQAKADAKANALAGLGATPLNIPTQAITDAAQQAGTSFAGALRDSIARAIPGIVGGGIGAVFGSTFGPLGAVAGAAAGATFGSGLSRALAERGIDTEVISRTLGDAGRTAIQAFMGNWRPPSPEEWVAPFVGVVGVVSSRIGELFRQAQGGDVGGAILGLLGDVSALAQRLAGRIGDAVSQVNWQDVWNRATNAIGGIAAWFGALAGMLGTWIGDQVNKVDWGSVWNRAVNVIGGLSQSFADASERLATWLGQQVGKIDWDAVWSNVKLTADQVIGPIARAVGRLDMALATWLNAQIEQTDWAALGEQFGRSLIGPIRQGTQGAVDGAAEGLQPGTLRKAIGDFLLGVITGAWQQVLDGWRAQAPGASYSKVFTDGLERGGIATALDAVFKLAISRQIEWVTSSLKSLDQWVASQQERFRTWALGSDTTVQAMAGSWLAAQAKWVTDSLASVGAWAAQWVAAQGQWAKDINAGLHAWADQFLAGVAKWASDTLAGFQQWVTDTAQALSDGWNEIWRRAGEAWDAIWALITTKTGDVLGQITNQIQQWIDAGRQMGEGLVKAVGDALAALAETVVGPIKRAIDAVKGMLPGGGGTGDLQTLGLRTGGNVPNTREGRAAFTAAAGSQYGLPPERFLAQLLHESNLDVNAVSPKGARGIAQFMPDTAREVATQMGVTVEQFWADWKLQVQGAAMHMRDLMKQYGGDFDRALSAYVAGPGGGIHPEYTSAVSTRVPEAQTLIQQSRDLLQTANTTMNLIGKYAVPIEGMSRALPHHGDVNAVGGTDIFAPAGTPIHNIAAGRVVQAGADRLGGNVVLIQGEDGRTYYYAHLQDVPVVRPGQMVNPGDVLGAVGNTGNAASTPPHLHLGIGNTIQTGAGSQGGTGTNFNAVEFLNSLLDAEKELQRLPGIAAGGFAGIETDVQNAAAATNDLTTAFDDAATTAQSIAPAADSAMQAIAGLGDAAESVSAIAPAMQDAADATAGLGDAADQAASAVNQSGQDAAAAMQGAADAIASSDLAGVAAEQVQGVADAISSSDLAGAATEQVQGVADAVGQATDEIPSGLQDGIDQAASTVSDGLDQVATDAGAAAANVGIEIVNGATDAINSAGQALVDAAAAMISDAITAMREEAGVASPSKKAYEIGAEIVAGLNRALADPSTSERARGLIQRFLDAASAYAGVADNAADVEQKLLDLKLQEARAQQALLPGAQAIAAVQQQQLPVATALARAQLALLPAQQAAAAQQRAQLPVALALAQAQLAVLPAQQAFAAAQRQQLPIALQLAQAQLALLPAQQAVAAAQRNQLPTALALAQAQRDVLPITLAVAAAQREIEDIQRGSLADQIAALDVSTRQAEIRREQIGINARLRQAGKDPTITQEEINALQIRSEALKDQSDNLNDQAEIQSLNAQIASRGASAALLALQDQERQAQRRVTSLQNEQALQQANLAVLQAALAVQEATLAPLQEQQATQQANLAVMQAQLQLQEATLAPLQEQQATQQANLAVLQAQLAIQQATLAPLQEQQAMMQAQLAVLQAEQAERQGSLAAIQAQTAQLQAQQAVYAAQLAIVTNLRSQLEEAKLITDETAASTEKAAQSTEKASSSISKAGGASKEAASSAHALQGEMKGIAPAAVTAGELLNHATTGMSTDLAAVDDSAAEMANDVTTTVTDMGTAVVTRMTDTGNQVTGAVVDANGKVLSAYANLNDGTQLSFSTMQTGITTKVTDTGNGMVTRMQDASGRYIGVVTDTSGRVLNIFATTETGVSASMSRTSTNVSNSAATMTSNVSTSADGLQRAVSTASTQVGTALGALPAAFGGVVSAADSAASDMGTQSDAIAQAWQQASDDVGSALEDLPDAFSGAADAASSAASDMGDTSGQVSDDWQQASDDVSSALDDLSSAFDDLSDDAQSAADENDEAAAAIKKTWAAAAKAVGNSLSQMGEAIRRGASSGGGEGKASGGIAEAFQATLVGEHGPEILLPARRSMVLPATQTAAIMDRLRRLDQLQPGGGGGSTTVQQRIVNVNTEYTVHRRVDDGSARVDQLIGDVLRLYGWAG